MKRLALVVLLGSVGCGNWLPHQRPVASAKPAPAAPPVPVAIVECTSGRQSERVAVVTCHITGAPDNHATSELAKKANMAAALEAHSIGATWVQSMNVDAHTLFAPETCQTRETERSRKAAGWVAFSNAVAPPVTATTHCSPDYLGGANCTTTDRPRAYTPPPRAEFETSCVAGPAIGLDATLTYELLDEEQAQKRGGRVAGVQRAPIADYLPDASLATR